MASEGETASSTTRRRARLSAATQTQLVAKLSRSIAALNWCTGGETTDFDQAGSVLGVRGEDVAQMCWLGLLKPSSLSDARIEAAELLRFLRAHGNAWMQGRLERMVAKLEGEAGPSVYSEIWKEFAASGSPWGPRPERKTPRRGPKAGAKAMTLSKSLRVAKPTKPCVRPRPKKTYYVPGIGQRRAAGGAR